MKVLYLTKYSRLGASSRLRSFQYFPFLKENGIDVAFSPLFNDEYLKDLYSGKQSVKTIFSSYLKRFFILFTVFKYDKIVIEKELFPYLPALFERILAFAKVKYIVDYDDAIFHNYDLSPNKLIRFFLRNKIGSVMKHAETVIAGNSYLASKAENSGAKNVVIIPTVIDISRYEVKNKPNHNTTIIGWIGSPSTFKYVKSIFPVFEALAKKYPVEVHIVGAKENSPVSFPVKFIEWTEASEVQSIQNFDIGIMPLEDSLWEKGKCAYKLIQYMACGIPVVASPVGMNAEVVKDGINGYLAMNQKQWISALEGMLSDKTKYCIFGHSGRQFIENEYTVQSKIKSFKEVLLRK